MKQIYLDYNASTPIASEVREAMRPWLEEGFGNPSSKHWAGARAKEALEAARAQVAALLHGSADEIVFTSGGTEANNHAIKGVFYALRERGNHIITTQIEHPAVLNPCAFLESLGAKITRLPVDGYGRVNPDEVKAAITPRTILVSVMHANNEVGTIQPISEIGRIARERNILLHTDAAQSAGKISTDVTELGVDLMSLAGHKLYAPKGVGALYIKRGTPLIPLLHGAGHESGRRAGTENVLLNVALGAACHLAKTRLHTDQQQMQHLVSLFHEGLEAQFGSQLHLNGHPDLKLPNTLNISIEGRNGQEILERLPAVAASTGSACHSGRKELSPVLKAMSLHEEICLGAVRFSMGRETTNLDIQHVLEGLRRCIP